MENFMAIDDLELDNIIVLNGKVEYCDTGDDNGCTIGVKTYDRVKRFNGEYIEVCTGSFPLTKEMEDKFNWGKDTFASIQMLTGNTPIDVDHIDETKIVSMIGEVESEYYHSYSDYSGYLGTKEEFKCGGHDIRQILISHLGEYIHMEIELYRKKKC